MSFISKPIKISFIKSVILPITNAKKKDKTFELWLSKKCLIILTSPITPIATPTINRLIVLHSKFFTECNINSYLPIINSINEPEIPGNSPNVTVTIPEIIISSGVSPNKFCGDNNKRARPSSNPIDIIIIFSFLKWAFPEI